MDQELETPGYRSGSAAAVLTLTELEEVADCIRREGAFCFDVETRGVIHRHPDVMDLIDSEWEAKKSTLKSNNPDIHRRSREAIERRWEDNIALDPLRNEVFWIGIAISGFSFAIPMGHPNGEVLTPEERGDGTTVPPPGYRAILSSGKESMAKAKYLIPATFTPPPAQLTQEQVFEVLGPLFLDENITKIGHNIKFDARSVAKYLGEIPRGLLVDTQVLQHVLNENLMKYSLVNLIDLNFQGWDAYAREGKLGDRITQVAFSSACRYVHLDARWTWLLYKKLWRRISTVETLLDCTYRDLRVLTPLAQMEQNGILVNKREMVRLGKTLEIELNDLLMEMAQYVPVGFSPDSNVHKAQLLFGKKSEGGLGLKPVKMTPSGNKPSVDDNVLKKLQGKHPMVDLLLQWAELKKMKSTYVDGLLPMLHNGRLHPSFHLHRTATSRLSSSDPNLQNIPRDGKVRRLFVAGPEESLLVADYDQIELRIMAMFSGDKEMHRIFTTGVDVHRGTAALILGKPEDEVDDEERNVYGKVPNFLMGYGGGPQKLVDSTNGVITLDRAKEVIALYNKAYSGLTEWKQQVIMQGTRLGYVETLGGRRRRLPDLLSSDFGTRSRAERQAVNAVIQGTAAEICKDAMIDVHNMLEYPKTKMLVQVHDELVVSVPTTEINIWEPRLVQAMGNGNVINDIPIRVSCNHAGSWADAKGK